MTDTATATTTDPLIEVRPGVWIRKSYTEGASK